MSHSFSSLKHLGKRAKKKDAGISFARSNRAWYMLLIGVLIGVFIGGIVAGNEFVHIEGSNTILTINPVETTKYHDKEIKAVLVKYSALEKAFAMLAVATASTTRRVEKLEDTPRAVASTTNMKVE